MGVQNFHLVSGTFFLYNFVGNIYCMKFMPLGNSCQGWAVCDVLFSLLGSLSLLKLSLMVLPYR